MGIIENSLHQAETALHEFISDPQTPVLMEKAVAIFKQALDKGCKIISCGNGGSLCDAAHFAEELTGRFRGDRRPLPAMAINDAAYMTCVGNDFSFDQIFARWVEAFGREGDVLLAISTSGNSGNVVMAIEKAKACGRCADRQRGEQALRVGRRRDLRSAHPALRPHPRDPYQSDSHSDRSARRRDLLRFGCEAINRRRAG